MGTGAKPGDPAPPEGENYYDGPLRSEPEELRRAGQVEGLGDEIALLRMMLKSAAKETDDPKLMMRGIEVLIRAVAAEYRLSPKASKHLSDNLSALLKNLGDQILPPDR